MPLSPAFECRTKVVRPSIGDQLNENGFADLGRLVSDKDIESLRKMYAQDARFRSHIIMRRHGFGEGEYKYFANPFPSVITELRQDLYARLLPTANEWQDKIGSARKYPGDINGMLARCHAGGQCRPTPLMLKYGPGDYNCLHQDLYGQHAFPLQVVILLSDETEFEGGEFVMTEQRPRRQSRASVVPLRKGHGVAFAVNERPKQGTRRIYRAKMRHGVSEIRSGERFSLGIIFHDAA